MYHATVGELTEAFSLPDDEFEQKYGAPKPPKDVDNLVVYCRSGVRAAAGCEELSKLGFDQYVLVLSLARHRQQSFCSRQSLFILGVNIMLCPNVFVTIHMQCKLAP